ncbi:hypothetical protein MHYP_G00329000 [Metynnis hypsauchen]
MAEMTGCKGILGQRGDAPTSGSILKLGSYPEFELVCRTEISLASRLVTWITRMWSSSYVEPQFRPLLMTQPCFTGPVASDKIKPNQRRLLSATQSHRP